MCVGWLIVLCGATSQAALVLQTEVINCSQENFFLPVVVKIDALGHVQDRAKFNSSEPKITGANDDVVSVGESLLVQGTQQGSPSDQGVLLRLDKRTLLEQSRGIVTIELDDHATPAQKHWADDHKNPLPYVWLEGLSPELVLFNHRTLSFGGPLGPNVVFDQWALLVNVSTNQGKLVYNTSQLLPGDQPLPPAYFGDQRALDTKTGALYLQACAESAAPASVASTFGKSRSVDTGLGARTEGLTASGDYCSKGDDIRVWDASKHTELRRLPMQGIAVHAMYFDSVVDELRGLIAASSTASNISYSLVRIDTVTGALSHLQRVDLPLGLTLQKSSISAFDPSTGKMALLLIGPSPKTDWSGGDPKSASIVEFSTHSLSAEAATPQKIQLLDAAAECTSSEADTRLFRPTLSYVHESPVVSFI